MDPLDEEEWAAVTAKEYSYVAKLGRWKVGLIASQLLVVGAACVLGAAYYPLLNSDVPAHFDLYGKIDTYIAKEYLMLIYGCFFALFLGITLLLHFVLRPGCQSSFNVPNRSWWLANPVRERAAYLLAFNWVVVLQLLTQAFLFCTFLIVFEVAREQAKWGDTSVQFPTKWFIGLGLVPYLVAVAALVFRMHRTFLHPAI